jgi:hypothetical protein
VGIGLGSLSGAIRLWIVHDIGRESGTGLLQMTAYGVLVKHLNLFEVLQERYG